MYTVLIILKFANRKIKLLLLMSLVVVVLLLFFTVLIKIILNIHRIVIASIIVAGLEGHAVFDFFIRLLRAFFQFGLDTCN